MKKRTLWLFLVLLAVATLSVGNASADPYSRGNSDHPLRYIAYAAHPAGVIVEYVALRPIHWLVSRKHLCVVFGHEPTPDDTYFVWH